MTLIIALEKDGPLPLHRQIYQEVQRLILSEIWKPGSRLPSTRAMSTRMGVSRATVCMAYEQLFEDGYLQSYVGSGTYVSLEIPDRRFLKKAEEHRAVVSIRPVADKLLSSFGEFIETQPASPREEHVQASDQITRHEPNPIWYKAFTRHMKKMTNWSITNDPQGDPELRQALTAYLVRARGLVLEPDQLILTGSREEALSLIARIHIGDNDVVAVEDPGDPTLLEILLSHGADVEPVPVDSMGILVDRLIRSEHLPPKMLFVSPSCQHGTGVSLSRTRRAELMTWCAQSRTLVIEDDREHELTYAGQTARSLQGHAGSQLVIYLGTFATVIPSVKSAYLVVPKSLINVYRRTRQLIGTRSFLPEQKALSELLQKGLYDRLIRKVRQSHWRNSTTSAG